MKKSVVFITTFILILCLTACGSKEITHSIGVVDLPLAGFHGYKDGLIIETDALSFMQQEVNTIENAYAYIDGDLLQLESFETEIKLNSDISALFEEFKLPIKYYIYKSTVYPYANIDYKQIGAQIVLEPIPNNPENILIWGSAVTKPIIYNVFNDEYNLIFTETEDYALSYAGISADGKYIALHGGTSYDILHGTAKYYVMNLESGDSKQIPIPEYDKNKYTSYTVSPQMFIGDKLIVTFHFEHEPNTEENYSETYYYDIKDDKITKWDLEKSFDSYQSATYYGGYPTSHIIIKNNWEKGKLDLYNLKTNEHFTIKMKPFMDIVGIPNESGRYLLGGYKEMPISYYDEGNAVYENTVEPYIPVFIDMEKDKVIDITKHIKHFSIDKYKGCNISFKQWLDETHIMITYNAENESYTEILDLKNAMK
ncbi:MAG: hypothetical protein IKD04_00895 [Clostridia bacterium]|nr:hypothetical protein [Clostridia bacterium]